MFVVAVVVAAEEEVLVRSAAGKSLIEKSLAVQPVVDCLGSLDFEMAVTGPWPVAAAATTAETDIVEMTPRERMSCAISWKHGRPETDLAIAPSFDRFAARLTEHCFAQIHFAVGWRHYLWQRASNRCLLSW